MRSAELPRCRGASCRSASLAFASGLAALLAAAPVGAQETRFLEVRLEANQTIRQLSERHLGDPDLWQDILAASNISSTAELSNGIVLRIPVDVIAAAERAIARSLAQIRTANLAGAQIFAPDEIGRAIEMHDGALERRLSRDWVASKELALLSFSEATSALAISESQREEAAEALLTDRQGDVEGQKPSAAAWSDLRLRAILLEEEKVRTLSASTAQLTFRDASRIRFNANSNVVIRQLRYDPLTRQEDAKVSLVEGDFYALLAGNSERRNFSVDIPGAKAQVESGDFWVQSGKQGAKFANYDTKPVDIVTQTDKVVLGQNEGVVLSTGGDTRVKRGVLQPVSLKSPPDNGLLYNSSLDLSWLAIDDAKGYWLEIGADQSFEKQIVSEYGIAAPSFRLGALPPGAYFWRVAALDAFGLPGQRSLTRRFAVTIDHTAPYLKIIRPVGDAISREPLIVIAGEVEPDAVVTVDGQRAEVGPAGRFEMAVSLGEDEHPIELAATDAAGNTTRLTRRIRYMPDRSNEVVFSEDIPRDPEGRLLTGGGVISLAGRTKPRSRVDVIGADGVPRGSSMSDENGQFMLNAGVARDVETLVFAVTAPSGFRGESKQEVAVDRTPPAIELQEELPRLTASRTIFLKGRVAKARAKLTINQRPVELVDGAFDEHFNLQLGKNPIELVATDSVGNSDVMEVAVALDDEPPKLVDVQLVPVSGEAGSFVGVEIAASDESGLAVSAQVTLGLGSEILEGIAQLNPSTKSYQGAIPVPMGKARQAVLKSVELVDAAGNRKIFRPN